MFPLRAVHKTQRAPLITRLLIVLNVLAFAARWLPGAWGNEARALFLSGSVVPHCYMAADACGLESSTRWSALGWPLFASLFLHAGVLHLAFNMLFLSVFGAGVEEKLGKPRFLLFYFACGIVAATAHIVTHPFSDAALVGASGAIAGILGAYFVLLPKSWILTYFPPIFLFPLPAPLFLGLWILLQFAAQFSTTWNRVLNSSSGNDVAWMAHIGGFACGALWAWKIAPWWKKSETK